MRDLYEDLGVPPTASQADIKTAFRRLSLQLHPDVGGDEGKFKTVTAAYNVLGDPALRASYDATRGATVGSAAWRTAAQELAGRVFSQVWTDLVGEVPELGRLAGAAASRDWFGLGEAAFGLLRRLKGGA